MSYMKRHLEEWVTTATIDDIVAAGYDLEDAITMKDAFTVRSKEEEEET